MAELSFGIGCIVKQENREILKEKEMEKVKGSFWTIPNNGF